MHAKRTGGRPMASAEDRLPVSAARTDRDSSHGRVRAKPVPRRKARRDTPGSSQERLAVGMDAFSRCGDRGGGGGLCSAAMAELTALNNIDDKIGEIGRA